MKLNFRIEWGYQFLYSRRHYHPLFRWDGCLHCSGGKIGQLYELQYPTVWFGPILSPREVPLPGLDWQSSTRRGIAGIRVEAEAGDGAVFALCTQSGTFEFTAGQIRKDGRLIFPVGGKYSCCAVVVTRSDCLWFRPAPKAGQAVLEAAQLPLEQINWSRMDAAVLPPGGEVEFTLSLPPKQRSGELLLHLQAMAARPSLWTTARPWPVGIEAVPPDGSYEAVADGDIELSFTAADGSERRVIHYFRMHDFSAQLLEDIFLTLPVDGKITLRNAGGGLSLLISRIAGQWQYRSHLDLSLPHWALRNQPQTGRIYAEREDRITVVTPDETLSCLLHPGWNDFTFTPAGDGRDYPVSVANAGQSNHGKIRAVYDLPPETPPVKVGFDMTTVPHDSHGEMDWLLDYTWRTQLGNFVAFRSFRQHGHPTDAAVSDTELTRWGELCRRYHIFVQGTNCYRSGALAAAAGTYFHNAGPHEASGPVYAAEPDNRSQDMRDAYCRFIAHLRQISDDLHARQMPAGIGDASGGQRHCYQAGFDFIRTETLVAHSQHLGSLARGAAKAFGKTEWGVHIAIQHTKQLYFPDQLNQYFLALFLPWMQGAKVIYEEDSLFLQFKEERQGWDDYLTRGKRSMTRRFFEFTQTHPRAGRPAPAIAVLDGRYAAPFNGFICGPEQGPDYAVWGQFGRSDPGWEHRQPEKVRQLLDVLMPQASTHPFRQKFDRRRFYFSGTPYGDFDQLPIEASAGVFHDYRLLLHLGWNTMLAEDYVKLTEFVVSGGVLLTSLAQFSTHVDRQFLLDMADLALFRDGDLTELAGVKVCGPGPEFSGQYFHVDQALNRTVDLSRLPSVSPDEDGPCRTARIQLSDGAEIIAYDSDTGAPLLVRHRFGQGWVYLLTFYAYPGHEKLSRLVGGIIAGLAERYRTDDYVTAATDEIFWTRWENGPRHRTLMLLNTDWTSDRNRQTVNIHCAAGDFTAEVVEHEAKIITLLPNYAVEPLQMSTHVEVAELDDRGCRLRLFDQAGEVAFRLHRNGMAKELKFPLNGKTHVEFSLLFD